MAGPIERSWQGYRKACVPADASEAQVKDTRNAFFGGAAVLFNGLIRSFDAGDEPTDNDMQRMQEIQDELDEFGQELDRDVYGKQEH